MTKNTRNLKIVFAKAADPSATSLDESLPVVQGTIDLDGPLADGEFVVKQLAYSLDPYMRIAMEAPGERSKAFGLELGKVARAWTIGVVVKSNNANYSQGDLVTNKVGEMAEYSVVSKADKDTFEVHNEFKTLGLPLTNCVGILGLAGYTAYRGLIKYGNLKAGETLYVSSAAGGVGQTAGQIAKIFGLRVVGSAGSDEKVAFLKNELGFDGAFNYKTADWNKELKELCPNGIDVYYDNVGGDMLETAIEHANPNGRIVLCGMMSVQNHGEQKGIRNLVTAIPKQLTFQGFAVPFVDDGLFGQFTADVSQWLKEGKLKYRESVVEGIENTPQAILDMMKGNNLGKQIIKVANL